MDNEDNTHSIVWNNSDKAKRWMKTNFRAYQYDMWADGTLTLHQWTGIKVVNPGDTVVKDKDGEPYVVAG